MTKAEIISLLSENHQQFIRQFESLNEYEFLSSVNNKWNASQQLDHLIRSVQPVVLAFTLPSFALKLFFGKANRPSRSYAELVAKYKNKLSDGGRASGRFVPAGLSYSQKNSSLKKFRELTTSLTKKLDKKTEEELDLFILPHPLLGKITLREMLYFTAYHAEHHKNQVVKNLETLTQV